MSKTDELTFPSKVALNTKSKLIVCPKLPYSSNFSSLRFNFESKAGKFTESRVEKEDDVQGMRRI